MSEYKTIGFIGLGVMGEPICRNLVKKSGKRVIAFDLSPEPLARLRADGAEIARFRCRCRSGRAICCSCACPAQNMCARCSRATAS